jgi:hypothetical protein
MKLVYLMAVVLLVAATATCFGLEAYECQAGSVKIGIKDTGTLQGPEALTWLFKNGFLKYADANKRKYPYKCPALTEITQSDLVPTPKFARWQNQQFKKTALK